MKNLLSLIKTLALAVIPFLLHTHLVAGAGGIITLALPALGNLVQSAGLAKSLAVALYWLELIVRVIPTVKNYSVVAFVLSLLEQLVPNAGVSPVDSAHGVLVHQSVFKRIANVFHPSTTSYVPSAPTAAPTAAAFSSPAQVSSALGYGFLPVI